MGFNICQSADQALVAYIVANGAGTTDDVFPAKRSDTKTLPCTIVWSHSFEPLPEGPYAGVWKVEAFIEVRTSGVPEESETTDGPQQKAADRTAATFGLFQYGDGQSGEDLGEAITQASSVPDFTVISCRIVGGSQGFNPRAVQQKGQAWVDSIHLELVCVPRYLT